MPINARAAPRYNPGIVLSSFRRDLVRTRRGIAVAALLGLLLVGMQIESQQHAIGHFGEWIQQQHDAGLQVPVDQDACATCALFAGGANAAPADIAAAAVLSADFEAPREPGTTIAALGSPSPYQSRAPPSIL
jgi:hypothetical protein